MRTDDDREPEPAFEPRVVIHEDVIYQTVDPSHMPLGWLWVEEVGPVVRIADVVR